MTALRLRRRGMACTLSECPHGCVALWATRRLAGDIVLKFSGCGICCYACARPMQVGMGAVKINAVLLIWCTVQTNAVRWTWCAEQMNTVRWTWRVAQTSAVRWKWRAAQSADERGTLDMARGADERGTLGMARGQTSAVRLIWCAEQMSAVRLIWRATQINAVRLTWRKTRPAAAAPCATQFIRRDAVRLSGACRPRRGVLAYRPHAAEPVCAWPTERALPNCCFTTLN